MITVKASQKIFTYAEVTNLSWLSKRGTNEIGVTTTVMRKCGHSARNDPRCFARVGVNRVAKALTGWQH